VNSPFDIAYGQNAEDVVLRRALRDVEDGFYVEVGANDPTETSISRAFYDAGWRGIAVEPVESLAARFRQERPRDQVVQVAATATDVDAVTLHVIEDTGLSTLVADISDEHATAGYQAQPVQVRGRSLDTILGEGDVPADIHFMVIDTEGAEADVLAGLDLGRWRPWVLVVEATRPRTSTPSHGAWEPGLLAAGYEFCLFDGLSRFYVASEHADRLRDALSTPAGPFDEYTPLHWHRRQEELGAARVQLDQARDELEAVRAEVEAVRAELQATQQQLIRWRGSVLARWVEAADGGGAVAGRPNHEVIHLRQELAATRATLSWRVTAPLRAVQGRRLRSWR
jgi:FkbM family methyltransferase